MKSGIIHLLTLATLLVMGGGLLTPHLSEAAVVKVQTVSGGNNNTTSVVLPALSAAPANGNTMIAVIATRSTTANRVSSITQTGATWSRVTQATNASGTTTEIWYAPNVASAGTGITITLGTATYAAAVVSEYNGLLTASAVDVSANTTGNSAAASTGTTSTTTAADELWIGGIGLVSSGYTLSSITNTFTEVANAVSTNGTATNNARVYALQRVVNATGAAATGGTVSTSSQWSGAIATFKMTAVLTCTSCHGGTGSFPDGTARNVPVGTFPGTHNGHVVASSVACSSCHVAPGATEFNHANGNIQIAAGVTYGAKGSSFPVSNAPMSGAGCSGITCHGSGLVWGTSTTDASCVKCHGVSGTTPAQYTADNKTAAPGYNGGRAINGATAANDAKVGAHAAHLTGSSNYSNPIACTECHANVNPSSSSFAGHMNGAPSVDFGPIATTTPASYTAPNCTTYCHSGSVAWNNTALLNGTVANDCNKCHGFPPATNHDGVAATIDQCNGCHDHVNTSGVFTDKSKHVNGVKDGGCSVCHGWPPTTEAHTKHINTIKAEKGYSNLPGGFVNNAVCGVCHNVSDLTKHAGTKGNDGTSRNVYLPSPYGMMTSYNFGGTVSYDKVTTVCSNISCHFGTTPAWGTPTASPCESCHGYPPTATSKHASPTPVVHIGQLANADTTAEFLAAHNNGCQLCHGTQDNGSGSHDSHPNYSLSTQHFAATARITMNSTLGYNTTNQGCDTAGCHSNDIEHRLNASGLPVDFFNGDAGGECVTCHASSKTAPTASSVSSGTVTARAQIVDANKQFLGSSNHIRSRSGMVATNFDCVVCHMEGDPATGSKVDGAGRHGDGYINLRDPDTGTNIKGVTHSGTTSAAGAYTPTATNAAPIRFSRNLGNATLEPDTQAIMFNHCLKCHDSNGMSNATGRVGTDPLKPFGNTVAANPSGGVLDIYSQFASTNRSFHPVLVRTNNGYTNTGGSRMVAPWNGVTKTATTTVYGPLITCWDCHAPNNTASTVTLTSSGVHGGTPNGSDVVPLRGNVYVTGTTNQTNLCRYCHVVTGGTTNHGAGSAMTSSADSGMTYFQNRCSHCHASSFNHAARPYGAADAHGYSTRYNGTAFPAGGNGYAFLRSEGWYGATNTYQSIRSVGATTYTQTCGTRTNTGLATGSCSRSSTMSYSPGGVY